MGHGIVIIIQNILYYYYIFIIKIKSKIWSFNDAFKIFQNIPKKLLVPILRYNKATIGNYCDIESPITFHNCNDFKNLIIDNNCHIGKNCFLDLRDKIEIGDNVVISMQSTFITHIDMSKSDLSYLYPSKTGRIKIHNNVYIGARSTILMGVTLGENSFVAAGSLVTQNVPPFVLVGGIPANIIKQIKQVKK